MTGETTHTKEQITSEEAPWAPWCLFVSLFQCFIDLKRHNQSQGTENLPRSSLNFLVSPQSKHKYFGRVKGSASLYRQLDVRRHNPDGGSEKLPGLVCVSLIQRKNFKEPEAPCLYNAPQPKLKSREAPKEILGLSRVSSIKKKIFKEPRAPCPSLSLMIGDTTLAKEPRISKEDP